MTEECKYKCAREISSDKETAFHSIDFLTRAFSSTIFRSLFHGTGADVFFGKITKHLVFGETFLF